MRLRILAYRNSGAKSAPFGQEIVRSRITCRKGPGRTGYSGDFVEHDLMLLIYPSGLTANTQLLLGVGVLAVNLAVYAAVLLRARRRRAS